MLINTAKKCVRHQRCDIRAGARITVTAPEKFIGLIPKWRDELFAFFDAAENALSGGALVKLSFCKVNELRSCGTLIFMSRLELWLERFPNKLSCDYPEDEIVEQLFQHVAILSRLGLSSRKKIDSDKVAFWHSHSGSKADPSGYKDLTLSVIDKIDHPNRMLFGDCLNEAICNTVSHAYNFFTEEHLPNKDRKWWIFSQYKEPWLFVVIYDFGEGIPKSLRRKPEWREYLRFRQYDDSRIIESAIMTPRTRTKQPERGKGLPEMLEFSKMINDGYLSIWSANGGFEYNANTKKLTRHRFSQSLPGTLVQWQIRFSKKQNDDEDNDINKQ